MVRASKAKSSAAPVLPLSAASRQILPTLAEFIAPNREVIAQRWADAYLRSPARAPQLDDESARQLIQSVFDLLVDTVRRGDYDAYYRGLSAIGRRYAGKGVALSNLLLVLHIYEEIIKTTLERHFADRDELITAFLAVEQLNDNALATLAASFFRSVVEEMRERNRQLAVINAVTTAVSSILDLQTVLEQALDQVVAELGFPYAEILLLDEADERLYPRAHRGVSTEFVREVESYRLGEGLAGIVARNGKPLFISDIDKDPRFLRTRGRRQKLKSALGVPLIAHQGVVGVMIIYSDGSTPWSPTDQGLLSAVGRQIGVGVENAQLYRQLQERADELAEAEQRRDQLMSLVAHEFREPITVIIGYGQMLARTGEQDERGLLNVADTIVGQAKRLSRLVDDLQDVSYIQSGRFEVHRKKFDLVELAREVIRAQRTTTKRHRLVLRAPSTPVEGEWDRDRITQVLVNLLSNAIKYSPDGGKVVVSITAKSHDVNLTVSDQGIGIARADFPHLFRPYSQLYRRQPIKGTGLGLFITIGIVRAHGGSVWVSSEPGKGTAFHITLPKSAALIPKCNLPAA